MTFPLHSTSRFRRGAVTALAFAGCAAAVGCRESARALGFTPARALAHADEVVGALAARFGPLTVEPPLADVRPKLVRSAFAPSRIYGDTTIWTAVDAEWRALEIEGRNGAELYVLRMRPAAPAPAAATESRAIMRLRRLGDTDYEWDTRHELAVGSVSTAELSETLTALLSAAEGVDEKGLRHAYRAGLPRTTASLARLFALDSVSAVPAADGGTVLTFGARMRPKGLADSLPDYARYLEKYVTPARYRAALFDHTGARWAEASGKDDFHVLRIRLRDGSLAPLDGPPRRMPPSLRARIDFSMKARLFRVGVRGLEADVELTRTEREKGFVASFRREPDWTLPPLVERMIRTPLRRPFEGEGALYGMSVRDSAGGPTIATRDLRLAVRESGIMRWFGRFGNTAMSDFRRGAEREAERYYREVLEALRADLADGAPPH